MEPRDIAREIEAGFWPVRSGAVVRDEFMDTLDTALAFAENATGQRRREGDDRG